MKAHFLVCFFLQYSNNLLLFDILLLTYEIYVL